MKLYTIAITACLLLPLSIHSELKSAQIFNLQDIHETVFDLYFPEDALLSTTEKKKRIEWRTLLWMHLQTKPEVTVLLSMLQPTSPLLPDDIKMTFADIVQNGIASTDVERIQQLQYALRRHPDNNIRKFAATLRRLYSYFAYANPLASKIAGYNDNKSLPLSPADMPAFLFPTTQLQYANNAITHNEGEIDYLIIGSGPAGSLIAHELVVQNPTCRVVLIDAGPFIRPHSIVTESSSELMESHNTRMTVDGSIILRNGRAIGGGSTVNIDLAFSPLLPQIKRQLQSWIDAEDIDASLIHGTYADWQHLQEAYTYVTEHIGTRVVTTDEVNDNNNILLGGTPTATTYALNAHKPCNDHDKLLKISAVDAFILPALHQGLTIIPDIKVKKILFDTHYSILHATGVEIEFQTPLHAPYVIANPNNFPVVAGDIAYIQAKNIIVCAGTLGSAELLLRSEVHNDNIGKGIIIHPSMGMYGRFEKEINAQQGLSASVYAPAEQADDKYFFESMAADPAFIALINPGSGRQILDIIRDTKYIGGFGIMLVDSVHADNRIFIDPATDQVEVDYTLSEQDKERFRRGIARGLEILFEQGASEVYLPTCEPILSDAEHYFPFTDKSQIKPAIDKLQFTENENFISSAHMQGSNKIGNNPTTSVVSHNFKVWDQESGREIDNLYICDSSIFPTSIGANPMQSIYTFAKLFIDRHITIETA